VRRRLDAINYDGRELGAYEVVPGFRVVDPSPHVIRIPLRGVFLDALHLQGFDSESPALMEYFGGSELVIGTGDLRTRIIRHCLAEEATYRRHPPHEFASFMRTRELAGEPYAEALHSWTLRTMQMDLAREMAAEAAREAPQQVPIRRTLANLWRRRQPAAAPPAHPMVTRARDRQRAAGQEAQWYVTT
jgi:hypothetical protein